MLNTKISSSSLPVSEAAAHATFYAWHVIPGLLHLLMEDTAVRMGWDAGPGVGLGHPLAVPCFGGTQGLTGASTIVNVCGTHRGIPHPPASSLLHPEQLETRL